MFSSDGKPLFVCKAPCFAKLEQGMSKVIAVEKIIRDLHGPTGATLALSEAGMTLSPASCADACTQTDLSTCTTSTAASVAKRQETATGVATSIQAVPGGSSQTQGTVLGKHNSQADSQTSEAKRFRALEAASALLGEERIALPPCNLPSTPIKYSPIQPHHSSVNAEGAGPCTPVTRRQTATLQAPHSLVKVRHCQGFITDVI